MATETMSQEEKVTKKEKSAESGSEKKGTKKTAAGEDVIKYAEENIEKKAEKTPKVTGLGDYTPPPSIEGIDGLTGKKVRVPIEDVKMLSRTIFVESMHVQKPTILDVQYRAGGDFRETLIRIDEETFDKLAAMPKFNKKKNVHYTYVSDFLQNDPNRGILMERSYHSYDPAWPSMEEILRQDKERARYQGITLSTELEKKLFPNFKDEAKKAAAEAAEEEKKLAKQKKDKGEPVLEDAEVNNE